MTRHQQLTSTVRVGCSGWLYKHWRGDFYPAGLPSTRWFSRYTAQFDTVEINNTFYRLPEGATFAKWAAQAPPHFLYAVKASRFLTHMKKLKQPAMPLRRLFGRAARLGPTFGPVLYQLPGRWSPDVERLAVFLAKLPVHPQAIEFRDPSWYTQEVFDLLDAHHVALCLHDMAGSATGMLTIGPFTYVRFHGTTKYGGRYTDATLARWADWLAEQARGGRPAYAYFNNDVGGHAPRDAVRLREAIERRG
jgi:uncharacterized protein YecE (DUF72 family)